MIPGVPSIGGLELIILLAIILLLFGAKRIPDLARSLGKGTREFRKGMSEGAAEDQVQDREEKVQEKQSLEDGARPEEMPRAEGRGSIRAEQRS